MYENGSDEHEIGADEFKAAHWKEKLRLHQIEFPQSERSSSNGSEQEDEDEENDEEEDENDEESDDEVDEYGMEEVD